MNVDIRIILERKMKEYGYLPSAKPYYHLNQDILIQPYFGIMNLYKEPLNFDFVLTGLEILQYIGDIDKFLTAKIAVFNYEYRQFVNGNVCLSS